MSLQHTPGANDRYEIVYLQPGTKLYHGSKAELIDRYPNRPTGNWFSLDYRQSYLHAIDQLFPDVIESTSCDAFMNVYQVVSQIPLLKITPGNFIAYGLAMTGQRLIPFTGDDQELSAELCQQIRDNRISVAGWILYEDQMQVMLCSPEKWLKYISSEPLYSDEQIYILCELINSLKEAEKSTTDLNRKREYNSKIDTYIRILTDRYDQPYFLRLNNAGEEVEDDDFEVAEVESESNIYRFAGWQGYYITDSKN